MTASPEIKEEGPPQRSVVTVTKTKAAPVVISQLSWHRLFRVFNKTQTEQLYVNRTTNTNKGLYDVRINNNNKNLSKNVLAWFATVCRVQQTIGNI